MDFSRLGRLASGLKPVHPIEIFEKLPNLPGTPNDIWRGQTEALNRWHDARRRADVLIALNTGAGKTLVGLLIAQSLVNEGVENVIYVCATIDLVRQTALQAQQVGLEHTTRTEGAYSNDLFASGRAFCVTTYPALFNGLSSIRRNHFPGAVIFDDAHVAETVLRDAFTLRVSSQEDADLYRDLCSLFAPHFDQLERRGEFGDATSGSHSTIVLAAPSGVRERGEQMLDLFNRHKISQHSELKYSFPLLRNKLDRCAVLFGRGACEITPPFLPSLAVDVFERPIRRIYLSATLASKADVVRAFGRLPDVEIEPRNDAGNGERLILFGRSLPEGVTPGLVGQISTERKVLIAVPTYVAAQTWSGLASPPTQAAFTERLNAFRAGDSGTFVLVSRVDGIDLPHETCRIMVLDGLPAGASLLERYQWEFLNMRNLHAASMANRIVQLFGRINRGRNDYGAFLIQGNDLNIWLNNDRNLALLPDLLQQQVYLGRLVQDQMNIRDDVRVIEIISTVLDRNPSWLGFYGDNISKSSLDEEKVERTNDVERRLTHAALAEARYARAIWEGDRATARIAIEDTIEETARADTALAGWHDIYLGGCYHAEGDTESAQLAWRRARDRLGPNVALPRVPVAVRSSVKPVNSLAAAIDNIVGLTSAETFAREFRSLERRLADLNGATSRQMEEAVRALGEVLGFESSRPDNDVKTGPDVLWITATGRQCLAFELKTNKRAPARYKKEDIGQSLDSLNWIAREKADLTCLGLIFVGPDGESTADANPSEQMWLCDPSGLAALRDQLLAIIRDVREALPLERLHRINDVCGQPDWTLTSLADRLKQKSLMKAGA